MPVSIHLCQRTSASCGACCGLYNAQRPSRAHLAGQLRAQTTRAGAAPRTVESFRQLARVGARAAQAVPYRSVRVCQLLGFLDAEEQRVGCLAHPLSTGGVDLRDCGVYTADVCESFTCPSFSWLDDAEATLLERATQDWYRYGLAITDVELWRGFLKRVSAERGRETSAAEVLAGGGDAALAVLTELYLLKERQHTLAPEGVLGAFAPDAEREPQPRSLDYAALGAAAQAEDDVLLCLGFCPVDAHALELGRAQVRGLVMRMAEALEPGPSSAPTPARG